MSTTDTGLWLSRQLMKDFDLSPGAAAGFAGNLHWECNGFKTLQEIKPVVKGSRGGYGWAQWTGPRRREFEAWAKENDLDLDSREANYGFLKHELKTTEKRVIGKLKGVTDPAKASDIVMKTYLRPGIPHDLQRQKLARGYFGGLSVG